ncbi:MAG TPA: hypothetical protein VGI26_01275 [Solirubrobacteraceae bacterium]|jgi:hypothetical protein
MSTPEQFLTDPSVSEVSYGAGKVAQYQGKDRWEIFYDVRGRKRRYEGLRMTKDVLAKQGASSLDGQLVEQIVSEYPGG